MTVARRHRLIETNSLPLSQTAALNAAYLLSIYSNRQSTSDGIILKVSNNTAILRLKRFCVK